MSLDVAYADHVRERIDAETSALDFLSQTYTWWRLDCDIPELLDIQHRRREWRVDIPATSR
jgi:hypothetical protein